MPQIIWDKPIAEIATPEETFRNWYSESPNLYEPRLVGASETIRPYIFQILNETNKRDLDFRLRETYRTKEEQAKKVAAGKSKTYKSKHLTGDAFDLVRFIDGKPTYKEEDYLPLQDIIQDLNIPLQQGIITKDKKSGEYGWWDRGHMQIPSEKGMYGGYQDWQKLVRPEEGSTYEVKPGDTLSSIAEKTGVSIPELQKLNQIEDPNKIKAGQKINLSFLNPFRIEEAEAAGIEWNKTKKGKIAWDKPLKKTEITWDKPAEKSNISWDKPTRGGVDWDGLEGDPFTKMSNFGKVLDIMGRPAQGIKAVIKANDDELLAIMNKTDITDEEKIKLMEKQSLSGKKAIKAFWRGLSGKERNTMNEIWKNVGVERVPLLGFASELAVDPLMYGGYSAITKTIGKGVGATGKAIQKIPGVTKAGTVIGEKIQPVTSALKEMFVIKTGLGKLNDLINTHLLQREYLKGKELKYAIKTRNVIQNIAKKTGHSIDDVEKQIVNLIEQPQIVSKGVTPEAQALANTLKMHLSNILTKEMKAGVPISSLAGGSRNIQYFPRITTKEAGQYLKQAQVGGAKVWNAKIANALRRKTGDFTLQEFNDFVATHGLKSLGGRSVEQFFMQQPAYAVYARGVRSAKAVTSAQFLDDVGKTFGIPIVKAPSFWQELPDSVTKLNPSLKGLKFDPEVMAEITRTTTQYINPQQAKIFMRGFDTVQNLWKKWTLAPFPKYHLRNMVGNMWNNHLAGVDLRNYPKAQAIQMYRKYKGTKFGRVAEAELRKLGITTQIADDTIMQAEKMGVLGRGWYAADIETTLKKELERGFIRQPLRIKAKKIITGEIITEKGMAFGSTIENNARLAHFIDRLSKGDDAMQASISVKKFLFDYGDLTAFEKQVMKRLFPFYTWTRKNIPLQAEMIWKQPEKFAPLAVPLRGRSPQDLLKLKYARPDLYERLPVELRRNVDTVTYVPLEGLIPAGDLAKMIRPQEIFIELLTPYLRAPIELAMNKSFYFESEIQRYPEETQELLRMDIPVKFKYVLTTALPQARLLNELNKLVKKQTRKEKLTAGEQAFAQSLSSIYKVNVKDLRDRALRRVESKIEDLRRGMFWAKRYERTKEGERIRKTYQELKDLMKRIKED